MRGPSWFRVGPLRLFKNKSPVDVCATWFAGPDGVTVFPPRPPTANWGLTKDIFLCFLFRFFFVYCLIAADSGIRKREQTKNLKANVGMLTELLQRFRNIFIL